MFTPEVCEYFSAEDLLEPADFGGITLDSMTYQVFVRMAAPEQTLLYLTPAQFRKLLGDTKHGQAEHLLQPLEAWPKPWLQTAAGKLFGGPAKPFMADSLLISPDNDEFGLDGFHGGLLISALLLQLGATMIPLEVGSEHVEYLQQLEYCNAIVPADAAGYHAAILEHFQNNPDQFDFHDLRHDGKLSCLIGATYTQIQLQHWQLENSEALQTFWDEHLVNEMGAQWENSSNACASITNEQHLQNLNELLRSMHRLERAGVTDVTRLITLSSLNSTAIIERWATTELAQPCRPLSAQAFQTICTRHAEIFKYSAFSDPQGVRELRDDQAAFTAQAHIVKRQPPEPA